MRLRFWALFVALLACIGASSNPYATEILYWCPPKGDGEWIPNVGQCDNSVIPSYPDRIHVGVVGDTMEDYLEAYVATKDAVEAWNHWLGGELLVFVGPAWDADIIVWGAPEHPLFAGLADLSTVQGRQVAIAWSYGEHRSYVIAHELGHLLGLRHDSDNRHSIMWPSVSGMSGLSSPELQDLELIREWYGL